LGDLTDELEKPFGAGAYISEFVATAPKSYAYEVTTASGDTTHVMKIKGFTLNHNAKLLLTYPRVREMVGRYLRGEEEEEDLIIRRKQIRKDQDCNVLTVDAHKVFKIDYDKRVLKNGISYPYGF